MTSEPDLQTKYEKLLEESEFLREDNDMYKSLQNEVTSELLLEQQRVQDLERQLEELRHNPPLESSEDKVDAQGGPWRKKVAEMNYEMEIELMRDQMEKSLKTEQNRVKETSTRNQLLEEQSALLNQQLIDTQSHLVQLEEQTVQLQRENNRLSADLELRIQREELCLTKEAEFAEAQQSAEEREQSLRQQLNEEQESHTTTRDEATRAQEEARGLQQLLDEARSALEATEAKLHETMEAQSTAMQGNTDLKDEIRQLTITLEESQELTKQLEDQSSSLEAELEAARQSIQEHEDELHKEHEARTSLARDLLENTTRLDQLQTQLGTTRRHHNEVTQDMQQVEQRITQFFEALSTLRQQGDHQLSDLKTDSESLHQAFYDLEQEYDLSRADTQKQLEAYESLTKRLQKDVLEKTEAMHRREAELKAEIEEGRQRMMNMEQVSHRTTQQLKLAEATSLQHAKAERDLALKELDAERSRLHTQLEECVKDMEQRTTESTRQAGMQIDELRYALELARTELANERQTIQRLERQRREAEDRLVISEKRCETVTSRFETFLQEGESYTRSMETLQREVKALQESAREQQMIVDHAAMSHSSMQSFLRFALREAPSPPLPSPDPHTPTQHPHTPTQHPHTPTHPDDSPTHTPPPHTPTPTPTRFVFPPTGFVSSSNANVQIGVFHEQAEMIRNEFDHLAVVNQELSEYVIKLETMLERQKGVAKQVHAAVFSSLDRALGRLSASPSPRLARTHTHTPSDLTLPPTHTHTHTHTHTVSTPPRGGNAMGVGVGVGVGGARSPFLSAMSIAALPADEEGGTDGWEHDLLGCIDALQESRANLMDALSVAQKENQRLRTQCDEVEARMIECTSTHTSQRNDLQLANAALERQCESMQRRFAQLQSTTQQALQDVQDTQEESHRLKQEQRALQSHVDGLRSDSAMRMQTMCGEMDALRAEGESHVWRCKAEVEQAKKTNGELRQQLLTSRTREQQLEDELTAARETLTSQLGQYKTESATQDETDELRRTIEVLSREHDTLSQRLTTQQTTSQQDATARNKLSTQLSETLATLQSEHEETLFEFQQVLSMLSGRVQTAVSEAQESQRVCVRSMTCLEEARAKLRDSRLETLGVDAESGMSQLREAFEPLVTEHTQLQTQLTDLEQQHTHTQEELQDTLDTLHHTERENESLTKDIHRLTQESQECQQAMAVKNRETKELQRLNRTLQLKLTRTQQELESLGMEKRAILTSCEKRLDEMGNELERWFLDCDERVQGTLRDTHELTQQCHVLSGQTANLNTHLEDFQSRVAKSDRDLHERLQSALQESEQIVVSKVDEMKHLHTRYTQEQQEFQQDRRILEDQLTELRRQLRNRADDDSKQLGERILTLQRSLERAEAELTKVESTHQNTIEDYAMRLEGVKAEAGEMQQLIESAHRQLTALQEQSTLDRTSFNREVAAMLDENQTLRDRLGSMEQESDAMRREGATTNLRVSELEEEKGRLKAARELLMREHVTVVRELERQGTMFTQELQKYVSKAASLKEQLDRLHEDSDTDKRTFKRMLERQAELQSELEEQNAHTQSQSRQLEVRLTELREAAERTQATSQQRIHELETRVKSLQDQSRLTQEESDRKLREANGVSMKLREENHDLSDSLQDMESRCTGYQEEIREMRQTQLRTQAEMEHRLAMSERTVKKALEDKQREKEERVSGYEVSQGCVAGMGQLARELRAECEEFGEQTNALEAQLSEMDEQLEALQEQETQQSAEYLHMLEQLQETVQRYVQDTERQEQHWTTQHTQLESAHSELETECGDAKAKLMETQHALRLSEDRFQGVSSRLQETQSERDAFKRQLNEARIEIQSKDQTIQSHEAALRESMGEAKRLGGDTDALSEALSLAKQKITDTERRLFEAESRVQTLLAKTREQLREHDSLKESCDEMRSQLSEKEHRLSVLEPQLRESLEQQRLIGKVRDDLKEQLGKTRLQGNEMGQMLEDTSKELETTKSLLEEAEASIRTLRNQLDDTQQESAQYKFKGGKMEANLRSLTDERDSLQSELSTAKAHEQDLQFKLNFAQEDIDSKQEQLESLNSQLTATRAQVKQKDQELTDLRFELRRRQSELESARKLTSDTSDVVHQRDEELDERDRSIATLRNELHGQAQESERVIGELRAQLDKVRREAGGLAKTGDELRGETDDLRHQLALKTQSLSQAKQDIQQCHDQIDTLTGQLRECEHNLEVTRGKLRDTETDKGDLQGRLDGQVRQGSDLSIQLKLRDSELTAKDDQINGLKDDLRQAESHQQALTAESHDLRFELEKYKSKFGEASTQNQRHEETIRHLKGSLESRDLSEKEVAAQYNSLRDEFADLQTRHDQLKEQSRRIETLAEQVRFLRLEAGNMAEEISEAVTKCQRGQADLTQHKQECDQAHQEHNDKLTRLQELGRRDREDSETGRQERESMRQQIEELAGTKHKLEADLAGAKRRIKELSFQVQQSRDEMRLAEIRDEGRRSGPGSVCSTVDLKQRGKQHRRHLISEK